MALSSTEGEQVSMLRYMAYIYIIKELQYKLSQRIKVENLSNKIWKKNVHEMYYNWLIYH